MKTAARRATVYLDSHLHRALKLKAAETDRSVSYLVNDAVRLTLLEDAEDLAAFEERAREPDLAFEDFLKGLKKRGSL
jgi:predicted transcriptional regulator